MLNQTELENRNELSNAWKSNFSKSSFEDPILSTPVTVMEIQFCSVALLDSTINDVFGDPTYIKWRYWRPDTIKWRFQTELYQVTFLDTQLYQAIVLKTLHYQVYTFGTLSSDVFIVTSQLSDAFGDLIISPTLLRT